MKIAQNLKTLRTKHGYTQTDIANMLNTTYHVYARYELGRRDIPVKHLIKLADIYGVSLDFLCGRDEQHNHQDGFSAG